MRDINRIDKFCARLAKSLGIQIIAYERVKDLEKKDEVVA